MFSPWRWPYRCRQGVKPPLKLQITYADGWHHPPTPGQFRALCFLLQITRRVTSTRRPTRVHVSGSVRRWRMRFGCLRRHTRPTRSSTSSTVHIITVSRSRLISGTSTSLHSFETYIHVKGGGGSVGEWGEALLTWGLGSRGFTPLRSGFGAGAVWAQAVCVEVSSVTCRRSVVSSGCFSIGQ